MMAFIFLSGQLKNNENFILDITKNKPNILELTNLKENSQFMIKAIK
jgi:hypothetical protein